MVCFHALAQVNPDAAVLWEWPGSSLNGFTCVANYTQCCTRWETQLRSCMVMFGSQNSQAIVCEVEGQKDSKPAQQKTEKEKAKD